MFGRKRTRKRPLTERALLADALSDLRHDQDTKQRRRRRLRLAWPVWLDRRLALAAGLLLAAVIADGVRRENQEFAAVVTRTAGVVSVRLPEQGGIVRAEVGQGLEDRTTVMTTARSWCELSFPDGSKLVLDAETEFRIKLLEYHRGGRWRCRSFFLSTGRIFARISETFGRESELRVYTPACVAAARGTRFSVAADPSGYARTVCGDGAIEVRGFNGDRMFVRGTGDCSAAAGSGPARPTTAPTGDMVGFRQASLNQIIRADPWYRQVELGLTQALDAPLTILGIGKCSWALGATDFARRTACQEALKKIRINLEGDVSFPAWINPATLDELRIEEVGGVEQLLKSFDGAAIESYWSDGRQFRVTARARDRQRTRYEASPAAIERSADQS